MQRSIAQRLCFSFLILFSMMALIEATAPNLNPIHSSTLATCQWIPTKAQFMGAFTNIAGMKTFFFLGFLSLLAFSKWRATKALAFVGGVGVITEAVHRVAAGHSCNAFDLIPGLLGLGAAMGIFFPLMWFWKWRTNPLNKPIYHHGFIEKL